MCMSGWSSYVCASDLRRLRAERLSDRRVPAFPVDHVVAGQRHRFDLFGELHLEDHLAPVEERGFAGEQVELPHPAEAVVVQPPDLLAILVEAALPLTERRLEEHTSALQSLMRRSYAGFC